METSDWYALGIPLFLVAIGLEAWLGWRRGLASYRLHDTLCDLGCGLGGLLVGVFLGVLTLSLYDLAYRAAAVVRWTAGSPVPWVLGFVGVDFLYYWFHRLGHEVNLFWAIHAVHHQSEEFNFAVALRQPWFSDAYAILFYWPLPILGVPAECFFVAVAGLSLYQVLLHTRLVGRPGPLGWLFNTPSHHRVHHSRDERDLDRNFGATLIVWDRLFGTFRHEGETEPPYGTTRRFASWNPFWAQVQGFARLAAAARAAPRPLDRLRIWFAAPASLPPISEAVPTPLPPGTGAYVVAQYAVLGASSIAVLVSAASALDPTVASAALFLLASMAVLGGLADGRPWARPAEFARQLAAAVAGAVFGGPAFAATAAAAASFAWLVRLPRAVPA